MFNNVDRINQQIAELERLKSNFQAVSPITNVINTQTPVINDFKAQYIENDEKVEDLLVQCKTAFIDLKNKVLKVKEINGKITEYGLVLPLDEKDKKILELEAKVNELTNVIKSNENGKSTGNDTKSNKQQSKL